MNRIIKFRAWDTNSDRMIPWELGVENWNFGILEWEQYKFMAFTGLTDSKGVEIYESDILNCGEDKPIVVGWNKKFASFSLNKEGWLYSHWFGEACEPENCTVIGNLFEHPNLLTK